MDRKPISALKYIQLINKVNREKLSDIPFRRVNRFRYIPSILASKSSSSRITRSVRISTQCLISS